MENLLLTIIQALVDNPKDVAVKQLKSGSIKIFEINANKGDIGKIIGKKGRTIDSVRTIFTAIAAKEKSRVTIELVD